MTAPAEVTRSMPKHEPPRIHVTASTREAAQRQYWRHVANRACLAILADQRHPVLTARQGSTDSTRPPQEAPHPGPGTDLYRVRVEPIQINDTETDWLQFDLLAEPTRPGNVLTLATLRDWPAPQSTEVLFRYWSARQQLVRRDGLSGDIVYLFEILLWPHAEEMLWAMGN